MGQSYSPILAKESEALNIISRTCDPQRGGKHVFLFKDHNKHCTILWMNNATAFLGQGHTCGILNALKSWASFIRCHIYTREASVNILIPDRHHRINTKQTWFYITTRYSNKVDCIAGQRSTFRCCV